MRDVEIELNVVGVRELLSYNNVPIGAPFVEIDAGDRSSPDKVRSTRPSQTPSGPDANFLETLVIHTRIPEELLFCPSLNVRVFDYRTAMRLRNSPPPGAAASERLHSKPYTQGGPSNIPVVGKVAIPLSPYCEWIHEAEYMPNNRPR